VAVVSAEDAQAMLDSWQAYPEGGDAALVGTVMAGEGMLVLET